MDTDLTDMDYVRDAIFNAIASNMDIYDLAEMSVNAESAESFADAVNMLALSYAE